MLHANMDAMNAATTDTDLSQYLASCHSLGINLNANAHIPSLTSQQHQQQHEPQQLHGLLSQSLSSPSVTSTGNDESGFARAMSLVELMELQSGGSGGVGGGGGAISYLLDVGAPGLLDGSTSGAGSVDGEAYTGSDMQSLGLPFEDANIPDTSTDMFGSQG